MSSSSVNKPQMTTWYSNTIDVIGHYNFQQGAYVGVEELLESQKFSVIVFFGKGVIASARSTTTKVASLIKTNPFIVGATCTCLIEKKGVVAKAFEERCKLFSKEVKITINSFVLEKLLKEMGPLIFDYYWDSNEIVAKHMLKLMGKIATLCIAKDVFSGGYESINSKIFSNPKFPYNMSLVRLLQEYPKGSKEFSGKTNNQNVNDGAEQFFQSVAQDCSSLENTEEWLENLTKNFAATL